MGEHPESALVRRFGDANILNILYLQAEIVGLQKDLRGIEDRNERSQSEDVKSFSVDWFSLAHLHDEAGSEEQWNKVLELRLRLSEYSPFGPTLSTSPCINLDPSS